VFLAPKEGSYKVTVESVCGHYSSDPIPVTVMTVDNFAVSPNVILCPGESTRLEATGGTAYRWSPSEGLDYTDIANPTAQPSETTTYRVEVTGDNQCRATGEVLVTVLCESLTIPSGFSPNDDGINDYFEIEGLDQYPVVDIWIYNRWGALVYKAAGYDNRWNGESNVGQGLPGNVLTAGTYYYLLNLHDGQKPKSGYIIIKR
jgi:gliding motility-associated-like protein